MHELQEKTYLPMIYYIYGGICVLSSFITPIILIRSISNTNSYVSESIMWTTAIGTLITSIFLSLCMIYAGYSIASQRNRTFVLVNSIVLCFVFPIGTVIGLYTISKMNKRGTLTLGNIRNAKQQNKNVDNTSASSW